MYSLKLIQLVIILSTAYCQHPDEGVILNGPQTQIVAPGEIAVFNCHGRGYSNNVYWYINGRDPYPQSDYEARGFNFSYTEIPRPPNELKEHNNTIIVEARPSNNNTRISCTARGKIYGQHDFQEGSLIIAGPPLRLTFVMFSQKHVADSNNFTYHLNWSAPFTWPGFPIISYNITIINQHPFINEQTTTIMHVNDSYSSPLSFDGTSYGEICYEMILFVAASNRVGQGEHTVIQSGHHIVPGEVGDIETTVTFLSNGTPHLWLSFLAPRICPGYQSGTHRISIYNNNGVPIHIFASKNYTQESEEQATLIVKEVKTGLNFNENYMIEVSATSMGIERYRSNNFSTFFDIIWLVCTSPTAFENNDTATISVQSEALSNTCPQSATNMALIVGITVGGISFLTFGCLCLLVVLCLTYRRMKSKCRLSNMPIIETDSALGVKHKKSKPPNLVLQAKNPIYEGGAMYETTPGESLKSLLSPSSVPCTPMADAATRYTFDFPPKLPPPRKGSVSIPPKLETHKEAKDSFKLAEMPPLHQNGDEYMVMNVPGRSDKENGVSESNGKSKNLACSTVGKLGNEDEYVTLN